ncbi:unnamed protein product [Candida verbasci]|uniref:TECPR1-like DysF domain-containing protein n=1 Tax=Candida verbasci TaxID=1227364 RepID=A0A9W4TWT6_9ASCO|nr:unnamed protein product [Candida verbasci]
MDQDQQHSPPSTPSSSTYKDYAINIINQAVIKGNNIADKNPASKRAIAINTASTLLEMGLDKYSGRKGSVDLTDEEIAHIESMAESADENATTTNKRNSHFTDRMIERLLKSALPQDIPERELFEKRLNDPERNKRPGLSITLLASNVKKLASKMTNFFAIQYLLISIISWKQPTKTLCVLCLYTAVCLWPHLVLALPLLFILFGILIPGYVYRHPPRRPDLIKIKKRGQSFFSFLLDTPETSIVEDMVDEEYLRQDVEVASSTYSISEEYSESNTLTSQTPTQTTSAESSDSKKDTAKHRKSQLALLINLRDFQNLTTDVLKGIDHGEKFYYETAGFKDERLSTFIFYGVLVVTFGTLFFGQFIPWRPIFIQTGWIGLILCHPKCKKYLIDMSKSRKANALLNKKPSPPPVIIEDADKEVKQFDRKDIIVDDSPEIRVVEVYELQIKSILKSKWSFYRYSTTIYDKNNKSRLSGKRPPGVDHLSKVLPPNDWKFDFGLVNKWILDLEPKKFIKERSLNSDLFIIKENEDQGWIYDNMKDVVHSDIIYEFRRRRLYRECYRYGRPHKKP